MKKILLLAAATVLGTIAFAQNDGEQRAVAVARAELSGNGGCLQQGLDNIQYSVTENYNCNIFDGVGINRTVTFFSTPPCPNPNQPCPLGPIRLIGQVIVDCDYSVVGSTCFKPVEP